MKKKYQMPEMHRVGLNIQIGSELAGASDETLMEQMKSGGYYENKVYYYVNPNFVAGESAFREKEGFLWERLSQNRQTRDDLVAQLAAEYRKEPNEVREDVESFLENALEKGLILRDIVSGAKMI